MEIPDDNVKISADAGKIDVSSATIDTLKLEALIFMMKTPRMTCLLQDQKIREGLNLTLI